MRAAGGALDAERGGHLLQPPAQGAASGEVLHVEHTVSEQPTDQGEEAVQRVRQRLAAGERLGEVPEVVRAREGGPGEPPAGEAAAAEPGGEVFGVDAELVQHGEVHPLLAEHVSSAVPEDTRTMAEKDLTAKTEGGDVSRLLTLGMEEEESRQKVTAVDG